MFIKNKKLLVSVIIVSILIVTYIINEKINDKKIYFPIKTIHIKESKIIYSNKDEIYNTADKYLKTKSFFTMDTNYLKKEIEKINWIRTANIKRARGYPNEVEIFIEEHSPVAIWNNDFYLNESGNIFSANKITRDLPLIISKTNRNDVIFEYFSLFSDGIYNHKINEKIMKIEENDIRSLSVFLLSNIIVKLGSKDIKKKIGIFFKAYKTLNSSDLKKIRYIDMRYSNGFVIGWK